MYRRSELPHSALAVARRQAGVLALGQLGELSEGSIRGLRKRWWRLGDGLYCLQEPTWLSAAWAGLLRAGPGSVLGGVAAAHLEGLVHRPPGELAVWVAPNRSLRPLPVAKWLVRFRRGERRGWGMPPSTRVEDTVVDAARELDEDSVVALAARALVLGRTTGARLLTAVDGPMHLPHRVALRALCREQTTGIESILEWRYLGRVERAHGLPAPERQASPGSGSRLDMLYRDCGLAVEVDGRAFHDTASDMRRDNRHLVDFDIVTLRYTWDDVMHRPCQVAAEVVTALRRRGWPGTMASCRRCIAA